MKEVYYTKAIITSSKANNLAYTNSPDGLRVSTDGDGEGTVSLNILQYDCLQQKFMKSSVIFLTGQNDPEYTQS